MHKATPCVGFTTNQDLPNYILVQNTSFYIPSNLYQNKFDLWHLQDPYSESHKFACCDGCPKSNHQFLQQKNSFSSTTFWLETPNFKNTLTHKWS